MPEIVLRKSAIITETTFHEGGPAPEVPLRRAAAMSVIANPYAGRYHAEIAPFMEDLKPLGVQMAKDLIDALGGDAGAIEGYGKGAIIGTNGELEHGALWHVPGGYAMRELMPASAAIVPSTKKIAMEVGLPDGPKADELLLVLVMSTGSRIHARVGGLKSSEVEGKDGLR